MLRPTRDIHSLHMSANDDRILMDKLKTLPPQRRAEVEDFIDFLRSRETDQQLSQRAGALSEAAFKAVWDNPDDADYDRL